MLCDCGTAVDSSTQKGGTAYVKRNAVTGCLWVLELATWTRKLVFWVLECFGWLLVFGSLVHTYSCLFSGFRLPPCLQTISNLWGIDAEGTEFTSGSEGVDDEP